MPENQVYKMVGPVLLKQDQAEAKGNVDKRLEFIEGEMYVPVLAQRPMTGPCTMLTIVSYRQYEGGGSAEGFD